MGSDRPRAIRQSLAAALAVSRADLYGHDGECASEHRVEAACFNENRPQVTSAIDMPPFPFMNRPTFQQAVEVDHAVPR